MGYPLREHYEASHPDWEYQKPIDEVFPDDPKLELQETVHFDLDPRNGKFCENSDSWLQEANLRSSFG